jgi:hypothetical protein
VDKRKSITLAASLPANRELKGLADFLAVSI